MQFLATIMFFAALLGWPVLGLLHLLMVSKGKRARAAGTGKDPYTTVAQEAKPLPKPLAILHDWISVAVWIMWLLPTALYASSMLSDGLRSLIGGPLLLFALLQLVGTLAVVTVARHSADRLPFAEHVSLVTAMLVGGLGIQMAMLVPSVRSSDGQAGIAIMFSIIYAPGLAAWCGLAAWGVAALVTRYRARRHAIA